MNITISEALDLARYSMTLVMVVSAPILIVGMIVGLIISLLQAVTQIQEQTLAFVPKMVVMALMSILLAPWMLQKLMEFTEKMFTLNPLG
jgi:flagellar biosynthetic protein FliQ